MKKDEVRKYVQEKWSNYTIGLAMAMSFREDKNYTFQDIKDAFSAGSEECLQFFIKNNII